MANNDNLNDNLEVDVAGLATHIRDMNSTGPWPMHGPFAVRVRDLALKRIIEIARDGKTLRMLLENDDAPPSLYVLDAKYFSCIVVPADCDVPQLIVDMVERQQRLEKQKLERKRQAEQKATERKRHSEREAIERAAAQKKMVARVRSITQQIERREEIQDDDLDFLCDSQEWDLVAHYYTNRFNQNVSYETASAAREAWEKVERFDQAFMIIEAAIQAPRLKGNHSLWNIRGAILRRLEFWEEAIASCYRAIELAPKSYYPYTTLGAIFRDQSNDVEADRNFAIAAALGAPLRQESRRPLLAKEKLGMQRKSIRSLLGIHN